MIKIETQDGHTVLLTGTVEHFEAVECKNVLSERIQSADGATLHIDLSGLESVSSIALSFLLFGMRAAKLASCDLHYQNMPATLFNMARVSGIESILIDNK